MPTLDEIILKSEENVNALSEKLKELDNLYQEIMMQKENIANIPDVFNKKFENIVKLTVEYTSTLGVSTKTYLDGNNILFTTKLSDLSIKIKEIEKEISRLVYTDFKKLFQDLQKSFIDQTRADLAIELEKFDEKSRDLQIKNDKLQKQIERLEKIDLRKDFAELQKTLSDILGAINSINLTLTNIVQTLTGIVQTLGNIQTTLDTNYRELVQFLNSFKEATVKHLIKQDNHLVLIENELKSLSEQNKSLKSEIETTRTIQVIGFIIIIIINIVILYNR